MTVMELGGILHSYGSMVADERGAELHNITA